MGCPSATEVTTLPYWLHFKYDDIKQVSTPNEDIPVQTVGVGIGEKSICGQPSHLAIIMLHSVHRRNFDLSIHIKHDPLLAWLVIIVKAQTIDFSHK